MAKKKKWAIKGLPYALAMLMGAVIVTLYDSLTFYWHLIIPWSLSVIFFIAWRYSVRNKTTKSKKKESLSGQPKVKRLI